ncbi:MAG: MATE family efflux transporter [Proteobacteria bacterium]|uniref:Multidrug-efflux transporter n=1 Tax=Candidatus Avisuccinivibrio stercorigallinarum TaxID=2840704 RepID=A0A9D9DAZ3_9GAMM|nr:MATE family efflux transporter [Candidatus Avisuccinivibrio stercorigallinarum]
MTGEELLEQIRTRGRFTFKSELLLIVKLATPSIFAQLSTIMMFYIDAAMVGSLGAKASASVGLMSSSLWVLGGLCAANAMGFAVQVAQLIGASDYAGARRVMRQSYAVTLGGAFTLGFIAVIISPHLPYWLGGDEEICHDAFLYFCPLAACLPFMQLNFLSGAMLRCSGNMKVPSLLNIMMCVLDVIFNFLFIFPTRELSLGGFSFTMPGLGLGVMGAAFGTVAAELCTCSAMTYCAAFRSKLLNLRQDSSTFIPKANIVRRAFKISLPMAGQHLAISLAQIVTTIIVAPLGIAAIAAHSFAITIESLCYMPGNGLSEAATTLVGQSIGAKRPKLTLSFARICVGLGMVVMGLGGVVMYVFSPYLMLLMTPDLQVQKLTVDVLRIEAFAEPLFGASIVAYGVFVGAGDTLMPSVMNFFSMWAIRLTTAYMLAPHYGLYGVWIAMAVELSLRGTMFLVRLLRSRWLTKHDFSRDTPPEDAAGEAGTERTQAT